jgi:hypothetical protein
VSLEKGIPSKVFVVDLSDVKEGLMEEWSIRIEYDPKEYD